MFSRTLGVTLAVLVLSACGGAKVVKEPQPVEVTTALAEAADARLAARLDWVIVRNASTAWAKNADWDEYHLQVRNLSATAKSALPLPALAWVYRSIRVMRV